MGSSGIVVPPVIPNLVIPPPSPPPTELSSPPEVVVPPVIPNLVIPPPSPPPTPSTITHPYTPAAASGCYPAYAPSDSYSSGDRVSMTTNGVTYNYACVEGPASSFCRQSGFAPGGQFSSSAWTKENLCAGMIPPATQVSPATPGTGCPKTFTAGTAYAPGDLVSDAHTVYRCAAAPTNQFCGLVGFAPGQEQYWETAWTALGPCPGTQAAPVVPTNPLVPATSPVPAVPATSPGANTDCSNDRNICEDGLTCLHSGVNGSDRWSCGQPQAVSATNPLVPATSPVPATPVVPVASPVNYVAPLVPPGTPNLGSCPGAWTVNGAYGAGARVAKNNVVYQCKGTIMGLHCPKAGYEPGVVWGRLDYWTLAWDVAGICSLHDRVLMEYTQLKETTFAGFGDKSGIPDILDPPVRHFIARESRTYPNEEVSALGRVFLEDRAAVDCSALCRDSKDQTSHECTTFRIASRPDASSGALQVVCRRYNNNANAFNRLQPRPDKADDGWTRTVYHRKSALPALEEKAAPLGLLPPNPSSPDFANVLVPAATCVGTKTGDPKRFEECQACVQANIGLRKSCTELAANVCDANDGFYGGQVCGGTCVSSAAYNFACLAELQRLSLAVFDQDYGLLDGFGYDFGCSMNNAADPTTGTPLPPWTCPPVSGGN